MNKTKIEWCDYTWNPVVGCRYGCPYCYAKKIAERFYGNFNPTFWVKRLENPSKIKKPSKIFVCSMADLFGEWVPNEWINMVIKVAKENLRHTFIFLTKNPARYREFDFPKNCWLGVTVNYQKDVWKIDEIITRTGKNITFVSFEPLFENIEHNLQGLYWIIIGAQTNPEKQPKVTWVIDLINKAREASCKVFLKNNLKYEGKIQEFPKCPE